MEEIDTGIVAMNLRVARAKANMTIDELAKRSGVGATTISFIENARKRTRLITLGKLADALGIELKDLLGIE